MKYLLNLWNKLSNIGIYSQTNKVEILKIRLFNRLIGICIPLVIGMIIANLALKMTDLLLVNTSYLFIFPTALYLNHLKKYNAARHLIIICILLVLVIPAIFILPDFRTYLFIIPLIILAYFLLPSKYIIYYFITGLFFVGYVTYYQESSDNTFTSIDFFNVYLPVMTLLLSFLILTLFKKENTIYVQTINDKQQQLKEAQTIAKIGSWVYYFSNKQLVLSNQLKIMFGIPNDAVLTIKEAQKEILPAGKLNILKKDLIKIVRQPSYQWSFSKKINGEQKWFRIISERLDDDKSKPIKLLGTIQDITERITNENKIKKLVHELQIKNENLERSNRELSQFASMASHDLQEPLRTIGSFVHILKEDLKDKINQEQKEYIDFITNGTQRMGVLIDALLEYSKVGKAEIKTQQVNSKNIINNKIFDLSIKIKETNAQIHTGTLPEKFVCEKDLIAMVFYNLLNNALKFNTSQIPTIWINSEETATHHLFKIRDNGIGIAPENHHKIFDIFNRLHRKEEYQGAGIGLALVKRIIDKHGGKIWIESKLKQGTTFFFTIPKF